MAERFWWIALAVVAVSAVAHLVSMLGTRWGDRDASVKALLFSLLVHLSLFCATFAVGPKIRELASRPEPVREVEEPVEIRELVADAPTASPSETETDAAPWERPAERLVPEIERTPREDVAATAEAERNVDRPAPAVLPDIETTNLPSPSGAAPEAAAPEVPEFLADAADVVPAAGMTARAQPEPSDGPPLARSERTVRPAPAETAMPERAGSSASDPPPVPSDASEPRVAAIPLPSSPEPSPLPAVPEDPSAIRSPAPLAPAPTASEPDAVAAAAPGPSIGSDRFGRRPARTQADSPATPDVERATSPDRLPPAPDRTVASATTSLPGGALPDLRRPDESVGGAAAVAAPYQLRQPERRRDTARRLGGSERSEQAVEQALAWLAANQTREGYWDADAHGAGRVGIDETGVDRKHAGKTADSGVTALTVLAFLGAGYTHEDGPHAETVDRALSWLIANQKPDGDLSAGAAHFERMYCHGMATYALAEAYGMQGDAADLRLRRPLEKAVAYILDQQGADGGWRYDRRPGQEQPGDMSMFGWQLMALKSAEIAGISVPPDAKSKMVAFLRSRSLGEKGGLAAYLTTRETYQATRDRSKLQYPVTPAMTAEALFCKLMLGLTPENPQTAEATAYLLEHTPRRSETDFYYWYYGTLAMFHRGGPEWDRWNAALRDLLVNEQVKDGSDAGSWAPRDRWGPYGGRIYSTAIATLSLEVYYRFLPLYRSGASAGVPADEDSP